MTIANYCILAACLLPLLCTVLAKSRGMGKPRREGGYDNRNPRPWLARLEGWQARANAAQQNGFEALPIFIAGVLVAQQMQAPQARVDGLALLFVAARIAYIGAYVGDRATLRSLVWGVGLAASIALFFAR
jgi:uncharacterized MAPEG superfamily protein